MILISEPEPECYPGVCGENAECFKESGKLSCRCLRGYEGDPKSYCRVEPESPCDPNPCGSNSVCSTGSNNSPICACQPGFEGDPLSTRGCRPQCYSDDDCGSSHTCINTKCIDPCPGACGISAHCEATRHQPHCYCPEGYSGDPYSRCEVITLDIPKDQETPLAPPVSPCKPSPCAFNAECSVQFNVPKCSCPLGYKGDPYTECRPECLSNNECDSDKACVNQRCIDPCDGICGDGALCEVDNHNPICYCPTHLTGDPFIRCFERKLNNIFHIIHCVIIVGIQQ